MSKWDISSPEYDSDLFNKSLKVSPWSGHRNFAYDLVKYYQPEHIVELGSHYGCSLFAFAQAVKDNHLSTKIYAVDTWQGDPQAGFYDESVYELVVHTKEHFFSEINIDMMRMLFSDAALTFEDDMFDLIHIDGLHTYEAVKEDFLTWLPKLKKNGIMLFHDTAEYTGYGSHQFWSELKEQYPHFDFPHSWGLGILFPKGDLIYRRLLETENFQDKIQIYRYKAEYELASIKVNDLEAMATERYKAINTQSQMIAERDLTIEGLKKNLSEYKKHIESNSLLIEERYKAIEEMDRMIKERDETIRAQELLLEERYEAIVNQGRLIDERDQTINRMEEMIRERDDIIRAQEKLIEERYEAIQNQSSMIDERDHTIEQYELKLKEYVKAVEDSRKMAEERYLVIEQMNQIIKERDETILGQKMLIDERYDTIVQMNQMIEERDRIIEEQKAQLREMNDRIDSAEQIALERYDVIQQMDEMIKERDKTIEIQKKMLEERSGYFY